MGKTCSVIVVDVLQEEMMSSFAVDVVLPDCKYIWCGYGRGREKVGEEVRNKTGESSCSLSPVFSKTLRMQFCLLLPSLSTFNNFFMEVSCLFLLLF